MSRSKTAAGVSLFTAHAFTIFTSLLIASTFVVGAKITRGLDPAVLTLVRFIVAAALFCPWIFLRFGWRTTFTVPLRTLLRCSIVSLCLTGFFIGMFYALRYTTALNTSVIYTLVPALSSLFSLLLVREAISLWRGSALLLGLAGALWVLCDGQLSILFTMHWGYGDKIFALACLAMSLYTPLIKLFFKADDTMEVITWWILVSGMVWMALAAGHQLLHTDLVSIDVGVWLGILYLAIFTTIVSFYLVQVCVPVLGPTRVMAYSYTYPALVLLYDLLLGHGMPQPAALPGVGIVCLAMLLLMREE